MCSLNEEPDGRSINQLESSPILTQFRKVVGYAAEDNNRAYVCFMNVNLLYFES